MNRSRIDAHAHLAFDPACTPVLEFVEQTGLRIINTSGSIKPGWHDQGRVPAYRALAAARPDLFAWVTGFDVPEFDNPNYSARVVAQLERDFRHHAVGCKLWRQIGMSIRKPDGTYMLMDDPILDPLYECLIAHNKTLLVHISEPHARWPGARGKTIGFYGRPPSYAPLEDEYGVVDFPDASAQIAAQNRMLAKFPQLRVVGAHFGGLEHDIRALAAQLDAYPNFAVDTSGRRRDIALQALRDTDAVRAFFSRYRDRILWGMDQGTGSTVLTNASDPDTIERWIAANRDGYAYEFNVYEGAGVVRVDQYNDISGLDLPGDVLQCMYVDNALRWYPGAFSG